MDEKEYNDKYNKLVEAFSADSFVNELKGVRDEIVKVIEDLLDGAEKQEPRLRNYFSIESRIKTLDSFKEKLNRKSYVRKWNVSDGITENQKIIKRELPDLIGLRIDCYFIKTEKFLYDYFKSNYTQPDTHKDIVFDFTEKIKQSNGHDIYKFSGIYKGEYHFEIQIKSAIHNVWGEVEHKTIYKNPYYNGLIESKKNIVETLFEIFTTSDNQLQLLFTMEEKENQLLSSLFFCYSHEQVEEMCGTSILGGHYVRYFSIFNDTTILKRYIVCKLSETEYNKMSYEPNCTDFQRGVCNRILDEVDLYKLTCLYNIGSILYDYSSIEVFALHLVTMLVQIDEDEFDAEHRDDFCGDSDDEEVKPQTTPDQLTALYAEQVKQYFEDGKKS